MPSNASALAGVLLSGVLALPLAAIESVQWNGFVLLRAQTPADVPLDDSAGVAQLQVGVDWRPTPLFGAHVHLLARNEADGSRRGHAGVVEAFAETNLQLRDDRVRILAGAFFLPTSRENIDSLWETPYTITSSALNSWMGEEFRPVGVDVAWRRRLTRGALTGGATVYTGNDTFGAMPFDRGWALHDRWTLLGEHVPTNEQFSTSVSAELDHRLGWAGRLKWNDDRGAFQYTRIDNRSDALLYDDLFNWATRFNIAGGDYTWRNWTIVSEIGWGTTAIERTRGRRSSPLQARYLLVSRRLSPRFRATLRGDEYKIGSREGTALTAAVLCESSRRLRAGVEGITAQGENSLALDLRYRF
jgi:hypothetical protein